MASCFKPFLVQKNKNGKTSMEENDRTLLNVIESADLDVAIEFLDAKQIFFSANALNRALIAACRRGHKFMVQKLFRLGANVNIRDHKDPLKRTPLQICAMKGYTEIANFLLKKEAFVGGYDSDGNSSLILSINAAGSSEIVKLLLAQKSVDIHHKNRNGYTALMKAIEVMDIETIKLLIDKCENDLYMPRKLKTNGTKNMTAEDIAYKSGLGNIYHILKKYAGKEVSPLLAAVLENDAESFSTFLDCQFSHQDEINEAFIKILGKYDSKLETNIQKQITKNEILMIQRLFECGVDPKCYKGSLLLCLAVEIGDISLFELLYEHLIKRSVTELSSGEEYSFKEHGNGYDPFHGLDTYSRTHGYRGYRLLYSGSLLDRALILNHFDIAKFLIQTGAAMKIDKALCSAVENRVPAYMDFLFSNYKTEVLHYLADVNNLTDLLGFAVQRGCLEMINFLIDFGADVNHEIYGATSLIKSLNKEVALLLISRGADVNLIMPNGDTSLLKVITIHRKKASTKLEVVKVLLENGVSVNERGMEGVTPLMAAAAKSSSIDLLQILLDHGADVTAQDEKGDTALIHAVRRYRSKIVLFLLRLHKEKNLSIDIQNHEGQTALSCALVCCPKLLEEIVDFGADINVKDLNGNTPLSLAVDIKKKSVLILTTLARKGCDVNCQNDDGFSPLMLAAKKACKRAIIVLLDSGADVNAVSERFTTRTALSFVRLDCPKSRSCFKLLLKRGANSSYIEPCVLYNMVISNNHRFITELIPCGVGPIHFEPSCNKLKACDIEEIPSISMFCLALLVGNISLARYFVKQMFLTSSDLISLTRNDNFRCVFKRKQQQKCLEFLDEMSSCPLSLFHLAFNTVSSAIGTSYSRESRVSQLPLPQIMKDKLLFRSQEKQQYIPDEYIQQSEGIIYYKLYYSHCYIGRNYNHDSVSNRVSTSDEETFDLSSSFCSSASSFSFATVG